MRTACVFLLASVALAAERYQLEPGVELVYEGKMEGGGGGLNFDSEVRWNIWIVMANRDGSFRIAMRTQGLAPPRLGLGDLRSDGTYRPLFVDAYTPLPATLFPPLPAAWGDDKASVVKGDTRYAFRRHVEEGLLRFSFTKTSPEDRVYEVSSTHTLHFDAERGLPTRLESRFSQAYGVKSSGRSTIRLAETKRHAREWMEKLGGEVEGCLRAFRAYEERFDACKGRPAAVDAQAQAAKALLEGALSRSTHAIVQEQVKSLLEGHADRVKFAREDGARIAKYLDKPAAEWMASDFADRVHSLKGYRGKVIVLDFWYRGCGWCVKAMPQVKALAKHFAGRPVVVLGANIDPEEEDARYVIKTMALTYPNLKAAALPKKFGVSGYPTVIVIDRQGVVRDYHVGYAADLKERLVRTVEGLLQE
ncbi:MAG: TlpA family protein disulfide reductase [Planctomycetota bacterium]|jgi:thiol-disulfide isomerase/thioredoxin